MSNSWYLSSAAYAAVAQFQASHAYTVGQIIRSLATPALGAKNCYRCTTAGNSGTAEPTWSQVNNATTATSGSGGTAVFTTVGGQSAYGWSAAAGDINTITNTNTSSGFAAFGDTIYVSSDHSDSIVSLNPFRTLSSATWNASTLFISVNRGGSVPPVAADVTSGALFTAPSGNISIDPPVPIYIEGCTFAVTAGSLFFNGGSFEGVYLKNCALQLNQNSSSFSIQANNSVGKLIWDNTTVQFANVGQGIKSGTYPIELLWINTPSAIQGATIPTDLFLQSSPGLLTVTCRGLDVSAINTTLVQGNSGYAGVKALFDSCKIASGVTVLGSGVSGNGDIVELVNCYDGTNTRNERYGVGGTVVTERTITLNGGATDDIGTYSLKFVSNSTGLDKWAFPLEGFWLDCEWNGTLGSSRTATVEIVSSASLNNDDISLMLEYQGTSSSPVASFAWSLPATPLTSNAAVTTSTATWNSSPSTPVYQKLQITFTPQVAGRVRGLVRLGKISTTVYVNPVITIT